jgi:hypothetical protein
VTVPSVNVAPVPAPALNEPPATTATGRAPLLPEPGMASSAGCNDAMAMLYTCLCQENAAELKSGANGIATQKSLRDRELKAQADAIQREEKAEGSGSKGFFASVGSLVHDVTSDLVKAHVADAVHDTSSDVSSAWNSPNFWHDLEFGARVVADVAAVVGSTCLTVATFGGGAASVVVVASLLLSTAGTVESNCHVLEACGVDAKVAGWVGVGLSAGGAAMGGVGALVNSPEKLGELAQAARSVGTVMQASSGCADVVSGGAHVKNGDFQADAQDATADATAADHRMKAIERVIDVIVDGMKDVSESHRRVVQSLQSAMETNDRTVVIAGAGRIA